VTLAQQSQSQDGPFQFGLIGDMPYTHVQEQQYQRVLAALNNADLAFVVHVGDTQNDPRGYYPNPSVGLLPCTDENYKTILNSFQSIKHPVILTPGDNDWADCHLVREPKIDPLERLAKVRAMFYPDGRSLGQRTIPVESQSKDSQFNKYRENLRWAINGVTFATLHIVGSNDNLGRTPEMDAEQAERKVANITWMRAAFAAAKAAGSRGIVLMTQANPGFENYWPPAAKSRYFSPFVPRGQPVPSYPAAFDDYIAALAQELESYDKPVAYLHGDTHLFRIDKPLYSKKSNRAFENFTRVETFGDPDTHWVRVTVDPGDAQLFRFDAQIIPDNVVNRRTR
jgi:predicted phosphodiesterase